MIFNGPYLPVMGQLWAWLSISTQSLCLSLQLGCSFLHPSISFTLKNMQGSSFFFL